MFTYKKQSPAQRRNEQQYARNARLNAMVNATRAKTVADARYYEAQAKQLLPRVWGGR
jgi:hypothetical protein